MQTSWKERGYKRAGKKEDANELEGEVDMLRVIAGWHSRVLKRMRLLTWRCKGLSDVDINPLRSGTRTDLRATPPLWT